MLCLAVKLKCSHPTIILCVVVKFGRSQFARSVCCQLYDIDCTLTCDFLQEVEKVIALECNEALPWMLEQACHLLARARVTIVDALAQARPLRAEDMLLRRDARMTVRMVASASECL